MRCSTMMGMLSLGLFPTFGCSLLLDSGGVQCSSNADCNTSGGATTFTCNDGLCLDTGVVDLCGPYIEADVSNPAVLKTTIRDTKTQAFVPGITQKLCFTRDSTCASPRDTAISNSAGEARLTFLREDSQNLILRTEATDTYLRSTTYFSRIEAFAGPDGFDFDVGSRAYVDATVPLVGAGPRDPTKAILVITMTDCLNGEGPTGVAGYQFQIVRLDGASLNNRISYGVNGFPSSSADRTFDGWGLLVNENPGLISVTVTDADTGQVVSGPISVELVADEVSAVWPIPQPQSS